jgi:hypothetical protein
VVGHRVAQREGAHDAVRPGGDRFGWGKSHQLLDYFVRKCRSVGLSWTVIGNRLGVPKQAARARFVDRAEVLVADGADPEPAPRLVACLDQAGEEARADGSVEVGTHHLLMGLMAEGFAAAVLERLQVRPEALRTAATRLFGAPGPAGQHVPPMSEEARCALEAASRIVCRTDSFLRTEHVLFVIATDPGSRARRVLNELGVSIADIKRELELSILWRTSRRRRRDRERTCSFCRRPRTVTGPVVAGPGVHICASCVDGARDALATPTLADRPT